MRTLKNLIAIAGISLITTAPLIYGGGYLATGVSNPLELRQIYKQRQEEGRKLYNQAIECFEQKFGTSDQVMLSKLTRADLEKVVERCEASDKRR